MIRKNTYFSDISFLQCADFAKSPGKNQHGLETYHGGSYADIQPNLYNQTLSTIVKGLQEALEFQNTKVLIFGKPISKKGRRMGVVLSSNVNVNSARECANKAALMINLRSD